MIEIQVLERCVGHKNVVKYVGSWKKGDELFVSTPLPPFHDCDTSTKTDCNGIVQRRFSQRFVSKYVISPDGFFFRNFPFA